MIKIKRADINYIASEFLEKVWELVTKNRLPSCKYKANSELLDRVRSLYTTKASDLKDQSKSFIKFVQSNEFDETALINTFFDYEKVINWQIKEAGPLGYWLATRLSIKTCPYCNRQYTFTIKTDNGVKRIRPQFDHFYPKSEYPYLALSFYNLIPCCPTCNHTKKNEEISIHPYETSFGDECKFKIVDFVDRLLSLDNFDSKFKLDFTSNNNNISVFGLKELYNQHDDYVSEIVFKSKAYNDGYYESVKKTFSRLGLSSSQMDTLIFGNYVDVAKHENRPLSKLTKDLLDQIKGSD